MSTTSTRNRPGQHTWVSIAALILGGLALAYALVLLIGANGLGWVSSNPGERLGRLWPDAFTVPSVPVHAVGEAGAATAAAANAQIPALESFDNGAPAGAAEFFGGTTNISIWGWELGPQLLWLGVRVVPALGLAYIWWLLFRIARESRGDGAWSDRTARRLRIMAVLVGVGGPLTAAAHWLVDKSLLDASTAAGVATMTTLRLPFWPIVVGLALLMAATLVDRARVMADDLDGLV